MIGTVPFVLCYHFHTSNSSTNDIVNSETIIVNNVSKSSSEKYSSNDIANSVFSTTVNNVVSLSIIEEQQKNSLPIFNSEMITVNNVIQANDDTEYKPVTLVGLYHLMIELYDHCSMITVNNASKTPSKDYHGHSYSMMDLYSSSTNDIVSSETITVNNASKTQHQETDLIHYKLYCVYFYSHRILFLYHHVILDYIIKFQIISCSFSWKNCCTHF